jgi:uncharacterized membrane protein YraQ (UPF0718 family)
VTEILFAIVLVCATALAWMLVSWAFAVAVVAALLVALAVGVHVGRIYEREEQACRHPTTTLPVAVPTVSAISHRRSGRRRHRARRADPPAWMFRRPEDRPMGEEAAP